MKFTNQDDQSKYVKNIKYKLTVISRTIRNPIIKFTEDVFNNYLDNKDYVLNIDDFVKSFGYTSKSATKKTQDRVSDENKIYLPDKNKKSGFDLYFNLMGVHELLKASHYSRSTKALNYFELLLDINNHGLDIRDFYISNLDKEFNNIFKFSKNNQDYDNKSEVKSILNNDDVLSESLKKNIYDWVIASYENNHYPVNLNNLYVLFMKHKSSAVTRIKKDFVENLDYIININKNDKGNPERFYYLSLDCAKSFCSLYDGNISKQIIKYFITVENQIKNKFSGIVNEEKNIVTNNSNNILNYNIDNIEDMDNETIVKLFNDLESKRNLIIKEVNNRMKEYKKLENIHSM